MQWTLPGAGWRDVAEIEEVPGNTRTSQEERPGSQSKSQKEPSSGCAWCFRRAAQLGYQAFLPDSSLSFQVLPQAPGTQTRNCHMTSVLTDRSPHASCFMSHSSSITFMNNELPKRSAIILRGAVSKCECPPRTFIVLVIVVVVVISVVVVVAVVAVLPTCTSTHS